MPQILETDIGEIELPDEFSSDQIQDFANTELPRLRRGLKRGVVRDTISRLGRDTAIAGAKTLMGLARGALLGEDQNKLVTLRQLGIRGAMSAKTPEEEEKILQTTGRAVESAAKKLTKTREDRLQESATFQFGEETEKAARQTYIVNPAAETGFRAKLIGAGASTVPILASAAAGPAAPLVAMTAYGAMAGQQGAEEAIAEGHPDKADQAYLSYAGLGVITEAAIGYPLRLLRFVRAARKANVPPEQFGKAMKLTLADYAKNIGREMAIGGSREFVQEGLEQAGQNISARLVGFDPDRELTQGVWEGAMYGGIIGAMLGAPVGVTATRLPRNRLGQLLENAGVDERVWNETSAVVSDVEARRLAAPDVSGRPQEAPEAIAEGFIRLQREREAAEQAAQPAATQAQAYPYQGPVQPDRPPLAPIQPDDVPDPVNASDLVTIAQSVAERFAANPQGLPQRAQVRLPIMQRLLARLQEAPGDPDILSDLAGTLDLQFDPTAQTFPRRYQTVEGGRLTRRRRPPQPADIVPRRTKPTTEVPSAQQVSQPETTDVSLLEPQRPPVGQAPGSQVPAAEGRPKVPAGGQGQDVPAPPGAQGAVVPFEAKTDEELDREYNDVQREIDAIEDRLRSEGADPVKLADPNDPAGRDLLADPAFGYKPMPEDMVRALGARDVIGKEQLERSISEVSQRLTPLRLTDGETKSVLGVIQLAPPDTGVFGQYMASSHTQRIVAKDPVRLAGEIAIALALERNEQIDDITDVSRKTLQDAARAVQILREYFGLSSARGPAPPSDFSLPPAPGKPQPLPAPPTPPPAPQPKPKGPKDLREAEANQAFGEGVVAPMRDEVQRKAQEIKRQQLVADASNKATASSILQSDVAQVIKDVERNRISSEEVRTLAQRAVDEGLIQQSILERIQEQLPTPPATQDIPFEPPPQPPPEPAPDVVAEPERKLAEEEAEVELVKQARQIVRSSETPLAAYRSLVELYQQAPRLGTRTAVSKAAQAYSTPPPLAYLVDLLANLSTGTRIVEPTVGHGMLLIGAPDNATIVANELDPNRVSRFKFAFPGANTFSYDATGSEFYDNFSGVNPDRIVMNPPFGSRPGQRFKIINAVTAKEDTTSIDLAIALNTLETMAPDGKAVLILGAKTGTMGPQFSPDPAQRAKDYSRGEFLELFKRFNVVDWFTVDGKLYERMGAGWPVDVVVIDGKKPTLPSTEGGFARPWVYPPLVFDSWQALEGKVNEAQSIAGKAPGLPPSPGGRRPLPEGGPRGGGRRGGRQGGTGVQPPPPGDSPTVPPPAGLQGQGQPGGQTGGPGVLPEPGPTPPGGSGAGGRPPGGTGQVGERPGAVAGGAPSITDNLSQEDQARLAELERRLREKLRQISVGIDPETALIGAEMTGLYVKAGVKTFADYARRFKAQMPDLWERIKRYLHGFWGGCRR